MKQLFEYQHLITLQHIEFLLRIILAGVCGFAIGYERKNRGKGAGIRTHMIVGVAASLMMIVSKYGFGDVGLVDSIYYGTRSADPARIAAQVVSGVGFLGAGMIYFHKQSIKGLTTAAGVWATAGIGLAIGAGMYFIGITSSIFVIVMQVVLHKNYKIFQMPSDEHITLVLENVPDAIDMTEMLLNEFGVHVLNVEYEKLPDNKVKLELEVNIPHDLDMMNLVKTTQKNQYIHSFQL